MKYIVKDFAKKDSRIKIINNKKNYGLCFSRVMGILNSKGEY
jgi:glycosyltransferase involved in cell wall biosynthesis